MGDHRQECAMKNPPRVRSPPPPSKCRYLLPLEMLLLNLLQTSLPFGCAFFLLRSYLHLALACSPTAPSSDPPAAVPGCCPPINRVKSDRFPDGQLDLEYGQPGQGGKCHRRLQIQCRDVKSKVQAALLDGDDHFVAIGRPQVRLEARCERRPSDGKWRWRIGSTYGTVKCVLARKKKHGGGHVCDHCSSSSEEEKNGWEPFDDGYDWTSFWPMEV